MRNDAQQRLSIVTDGEVARDVPRELRLAAAECRNEGECQQFAELQVQRGTSPFEFQRLFPPPLKAAFRAFAMNDLGISPAIEGENWNLPKSRRWLVTPSNAPFKLHAHYRLLDDATRQARTYLEAKGVDVQALDL